jgi:hypothetical protein
LLDANAVEFKNNIEQFGGSLWDYHPLQADANKSSCGGVHKKNRQ